MMMMTSLVEIPAALAAYCIVERVRVRVRVRLNLS
jgi:hypothetical protein